MDFVINNPNMPQNMFQGQPNNMPMYQNPQYVFNHFDSKKLILFFTNASRSPGIESNRIHTESTHIITYPSGVPTEEAAQSGSFSTAEYNDDGTFKFTLIEPLQVDKMSDVFLDNLTFVNASFNASTTPEHYGVVLQINELQQNIVSNNTLINNKELIVVNSSSNPSARPVYYESKKKKFNYLGVIPPGNYKEINGRLCDLKGNWIKNCNHINTLCFSIELIISNQH